MKRVLPLLALTIALSACNGRREAAVESRIANAPVILISIDTLRADHLPLHGYRAIATPAIDALASEGVVFDEAWSPCPMTLPSHVTMLTGLLPTEHGVRNNLGFTYDASKHTSISSLLKARGYATGAAVSSYVMRGETGLRAAFDWYEDSLDPGRGAAFGEYQRKGDVTRELAQKWIDAQSGKPFFLFLHLYEPHVPYEPSYDADIIAADAIVGRFIAHLKARGIYDEALIVLTSDHGEGLGDHGEEQHGILLYTESLRVPLVVKLPRSDRKGTRIAAPAALTDLLPTITTLLGIEKPAAVRAPTLFALPAEREVYSESIYPYLQLGWSDLYSLAAGGFHYIESPKPELYDLRRDPRETKNVIAEERRVAARMQSALAAIPRPAVTTETIDPEVAKKLASLGYVGSARTRPDPKTLPNPRDEIGLLQEIQSAFQSGGEAQLKAILARNPRLVDVWKRLGEVQSENGDVNGAIESYKAAMASAGVFASDLALALGDAQLQAGRMEDATQSAQLALNGSGHAARALLARIALAKGDSASAERYARELTSSPNALPSQFLLLSEALVARGDLQGAMNAITDAERMARERGIARVEGLEMQRGDVLARLQRMPEAIAAIEKEIVYFPSNRAAYSRLAVMYHLAGDRAAVERTLERLVTANPGSAARALAAKTRAALRG
jgi:arylsulfatase A-like enzyme/tetratricopeptide (TPR) repeat protein